MTRGAVLSAMLLLSSTASADEAYYPEPLAPEPAPAPAPAPPPVYAPTYAPPPMMVPVQPVQPAYVAPDLEDGPKSPGTAGMLSFFSTVAPPLVAAAMYGDNDDEDNDGELATILITSVMIGPSVGHLYAGKLVTPGLGMRALGFGLGVAAFESNDLDDAIGLLLLGSSCILGGAVYDIVTAGRSAREYNFEHAKRMLPTVSPVVGAGGQTSGMQVGLAGTF